MRVLLGTIIAGDSKGYAIQKFEEMCAAMFADVDILAVVDQPYRTTLPQYVLPALRNREWATEIVYYGKGMLEEYAVSHDYDALVWQGIDCFYSERWEFDRLIDGLSKHEIVGGLVAGRDRENVPVCRRFLDRDGVWLKQQMEIPWVTDARRRGLYVVPGYIGSDATAISRLALETVTMDGYQHWHLRMYDPKFGLHGWDQQALGPEEYWMWSAVSRHGMWPAVDTSVRPWHAHQTGRTVRYRGEVCELDDLQWLG